MRISFVSRDSFRLLLRRTELTFTELTASDVFQDGRIGQVQASDGVSENVTKVTESTVPSAGSSKLLSRDDIECEVS